jgi:hypothetical protein
VLLFLIELYLIKSIKCRVVVFGDFGLYNQELLKLRIYSTNTLN